MSRPDKMCSIKHDQKIQVFVRIRPYNQQEKDTHVAPCLEASGTKEIILKQQHGKRYAFDKVFGGLSKQIDLYCTVVKPMIAEVLTGYNCTVFAYGQTGTGKTYTMTGISESLLDFENVGIIPRAMGHLFEELLLSQQEYSVRVSYVELYNEELIDLLADGEPNRLRLYEDQKQKGSVFIQGLEEVIVHNKSQVIQLLQKGFDKRRTACTLMNASSSRSHTVFSAVVHIRETTEDGEELMKTGKINFVDLAGSENISRSGAIDKRAREAGNINQSLLTLGRVIKSLVEKAAHIPYRESKLTRILQDSLGGRTKTSIIATVSPGFNNLEETLSTLDYAHRARNITNRPEINQRMSKRALLNEYSEEIERLKKDLMASRTGQGVYLDDENYNRLMVEQDLHKQELTERITQIRDLELKIEDIEKCKEQIETNFLQCSSSLVQARTTLMEYQVKLKETENASAEKEKVINSFAETQKVLKEQAETLLKVANQSTTNENVLRNKVENLYGASFENKLMLDNFINTFNTNYNKQQNNINNLNKQRECFTESLLNSMQIWELEQKDINGRLKEYVSSVQEMLDGFGAKLKVFTNCGIKLVEELCSKTTQDSLLALNQMAANLNTSVDKGSKDLLNLENTIEESKERHAVFLQKINTQLKTIDDLNHSGLDNATQSLEKMQEDIEKFMNILESKLKKSDMHITSQTKETNLMNEQIRQKLDELNLLFVKHNIYINAGTSTQLSINNEIREETQKTRFVDNLNKILEVKRFETEKTDTALKNIYKEVNENIEKSEELNFAFRTNCDIIEANLVNVATTFKNDHNELQTNISASMANLCSRNSNALNLSLHPILKNVRTMETDATLVGIETCNSMEALITSNNEMKNELKKFDQHCESSCTTIKQVTKLLNTNFDEFSKEFKLPQHSGDTPARVQRQYPRVLASTPDTCVRYRSKLNFREEVSPTE